eukprot:TRINITY_DN12811_c0_g1_i1.p1 TRINITY_DN12811_c0_g1~~TRINITY_DN12811_c0_g1_i1.p1  ORF type:complete len:333 (-),score=48.29 TRINITY_DN12811_c0_g1_i1:21-1019(-)
MALRWWTDQNVGNIVSLEHVNLEVPDLYLSKIFYGDALGCAVDPHKTAKNPKVTWYNLGYQQFHVRWNSDSPAQIMDGHVGLIVPSLQRALERLSISAPHLKGTKFQIAVVEDHTPRRASPAPSRGGDRGGDSDDDAIPKPPYLPIPVKGMTRYISVTCPWGNQYRLYENTPDLQFRSGAGIAYVETMCPPHTLKVIADFYRDIIGSLAEIEETQAGGVLRVCAGVHQQLIFREKEVDDRTEYEQENGRGYHICYYVANFSDTFKRLDEEQLVGEEKYNDKYPNLQAALKACQLRFEKLSIKGVRLMVLEQEVRSLFHTHFNRALVNSITST